MRNANTATVKPHTVLRFSARAVASHAGKHINSYTDEFKVEVVEWHRKNRENCCLTSMQYRVDRKGIREWEKAYDRLVPLCYGKTR